jgi:hypothetical protein
MSPPKAFPRRSPAKKRKDCDNDVSLDTREEGQEAEGVEAAMQQAVHLDNRKNILPTVPCRHNPDLNVLAPETIKTLLDGGYSEQLSGFLIVDCRFGYEYEGGHIDGAHHLKDPAEVEHLLFQQVVQESAKFAVIFHCEFSQNRAPKM